MEIEIRAWLYDVLKAIAEIESFLREVPMDFEEYQNDIRTKRAVERNIEIIGDALRRILKRDKTVSITDARKIIDTRNRIIHGYDSVSDHIMWGIIVNYLPSLKSEGEAIFLNQ